MAWMDEATGARARSLTVAACLSMVTMACGGETRATADSAAPTSTAAATATTAAAAGGASSGEQLYQRCMTCHQANGEGVAGSFPPLAGSEYANAANPAVPIRIVLRGMQGPVTVKGAQYNSLMPPYGTGMVMSDDEVAAVLTYVRSSWGNTGGAVTPQQVAQERASLGASPAAVTAEELKSMM